MSISREDVLHIARLARLSLSETEVQQMVTDLGNILEHVQKLQAVDTSGVTLTSYIAVEQAPFRADAAVPGVETDVALAQAPRHAEGAFAVPGFVE